jgi:hypothetical protein
MQTPTLAVSWRLLAVLVVLMCLGPALFWRVVEEKPVQQLENQVIPIEETDSYYSISDRRCYALVYTNTIPFSHTLELPLVGIILTDTYRQPSIITVPLDLQSGQITSVTLESGRQVLVAEDRAGRRATLGVFYWPRASLTAPLTRTLVISLSNQEIAATYVAQAPIESVPAEFTELSAGQIEPGFFVKRIFYPNQPDENLSTCKRKETNVFTGGELSAIYSPDISLESGIMRVTIKADASGWHYNPQKTALQLLGVSPAADGSTSVTLFHNWGSVREITPTPEPGDWRKMIRWANVMSPISLTYDPRPAPVATTSTRDLAQSLIHRLCWSLDKLNESHFAFSLLTTSLAPLLMLGWIGWRCKRHLSSAWPRLAIPLGLGVLMWVGPLGAVSLEAVFHDGSMAYTSAALWIVVLVNGLLVSLLASLTTTRLATRMRTWFGQRKALGWLGSFLLTVGLAALLWALLANLNYIWRHPLALPVEGLLLALVTWSLVKALNVAIPRAAWILWAALMFLLAVPLPETVHLFDPIIGWPIEIGRGLFLLWGICVLPYLGLLSCVAALKSLGPHYSPPPLELSRWMFIFLVGFTGAFPQVLPGGGNVSVVPLPYLLSPIPFILAWLFFRAIARPPSMPDVQALNAFLTQRKEHVLKNAAFPKKKEVLSKMSVEKRTSATKTPAPVGQSRSPEQVRSSAPELSSKERRELLTIGPRQGDWKNGCLAARYGFVLGGTLALFYGVLLLPNVVNQLHTPFLPLMMLFGFVLPIFLRWVLAGFFLGYFFIRLPGRSGAIKGFSLACAIAASVFVYDVVFRVQSIADFQIFFTIDVALTVLGLTGMGAALDYHTIRQTGQTWKQLLGLYRVPYLAGYLSTLLAAISATVVNLVNGRITNLVANLVKAILRVSGG